ncbi:M56 family metallopeptidase [Solitalea koreensis]|uniref:Signal transducer regulating beta-lactamase production, contains metallopeptidase domain n=1 Tax=Solitalea koreensis TaxID=543615 RepID=A0A521EB88_9SPHI|nr:M56 family metallopeptidase [Solitalea koreensis]SMO81173.1 Signal transducer regulating beta-lactamase production, contains metallopeptidase domain [Solitalea koreensis]
MIAFNLFSGSFEEALGWTLIHSIWQIAAAAIVVVGMMTVLQNKSARLRYYVALSGLFGAALFSIITFISVYQPNSAGGQEQVMDQLSITQIIFSPAIAESAWITSFNHILNFVEQNLSLIVGVWMLGVLLLTIRFLAGLVYVTKLKNKGHLYVSSYWKSKLNKLAKRMELNRQVELFESVWIKVPTVIGYIKPVVLVPIGTFAALPADQLEAILAHELAHIKRNDYLINIFQSIIEIVYFFHPGIWWMGQIVRKERELCCDDLALECGCDSLTLARALANIEELAQLSTHELAMAINGKGRLLNRIND